MKKIDETGNKYGRLTVLEEGKSYLGMAMWWCRCECGISKKISGISLRSGTKSCGCLQREATRADCRNARAAYLKAQEG